MYRGGNSRVPHWKTGKQGTRALKRAPTRYCSVDICAKKRAGTFLAQYGNIVIPIRHWNRLVDLVRGELLHFLTFDVNLDN
jgi:hypothetical protein